MNSERAKQLVADLHARFDGFALPESTERRWIDWLVARAEPEQAVVDGVRALIIEWAHVKRPGVIEIGKAIAKANAELGERGKFRRLYDRARDLRLKYGDSYLAMFAKPSADECPACAADYIAKGVEFGNAFLRHAHFTLGDLDKDPALEVAIALAREKTPHPLQAAMPKTETE